MTDKCTGCAESQEKAKELKVLLSDMDVKIVYGMEGLIEAATIDEAVPANEINIPAIIDKTSILPIGILTLFMPLSEYFIVASFAVIIISS